MVARAARGRHARPCLWALGAVVASGSTDAVLPFACRLFTEAMPRAETLISPRAWAFALLGAHLYLRRFGGDERVRRLQGVLSQRLLEAFRSNASADMAVVRGGRHVRERVPAARPHPERPVAA